MSRQRREPDLTANRQVIADLRAAADTARVKRGNTLLAALFEAAADAAENTPVSGRFGIPREVVARDLAEELRWGAVIVRLHAMARTLLPAALDPADPRVDLDRVVAGGAA